MAFNDEETKVSSEIDRTKITFLQLSDSDGGYIFCLIKDIIYIFSPEVNLKTSFDLKNEIQGTYYSMNFHKNENNKIYYSLAFVNSKKQFILIYYELDLTENKNNLKYSISHEPTNSKGGITTSFEINVSCEEMIHHSEGKVLVCFYENRNYDPQEMSISIFNPERNFEVITSISQVYISLSSQINFIEIYNLIL